MPNGHFTSALNALKKRDKAFEAHHQLVELVVQELNLGFKGTGVTANAEHHGVLDNFVTEIALIRRTDKGSECFCWIKLSPFAPRAQTQIIEEILNKFIEKMSRK